MPTDEEEEWETITIELSVDELATIALAAHRLDLTLNEFFNRALREAIRRVELEVARGLRRIADQETMDRETWLATLRSAADIIELGTIVT